MPTSIRILIKLVISRLCYSGFIVAAEVSIAIRLQGPMSANGTGRVEVFYKGEWGTICDDDWDINDAKVVCRQLGYQYGSRAFHGNNIDPGSGKIWLDDVDCNGSEKNVTSCSHAGWGNHDCTHDEDAGVECLTAGEKYVLFPFMHSLYFQNLVS